MDILDMIGNTPLVEVQGMDTGKCRLFLKLESQNPGASIKDRIALTMIKGAEARGDLKPGGIIVEATAGNTGIGLALVAVKKNYRVILVVPDKMSREKVNQLRALGAQVVSTRSDVVKGHPEYYQDRARAIAAEFPNAWYADQFSNPDNVYAHEHSTAPEIWEQMEHAVDAIVVGVGSGGTLGGLTRYFSRRAPDLQMVIADPEGSVIAPYVRSGKVPGECGSWLVEGIGEDFIPSNADFSMVRTAYTISDKESLLTGRELLRTNGILAGSSSGTLLAAALKYCREQNAAKRVVSFVCDSGARYLSKMYSDLWMVDHGFLPAPHFGDLRDLIARHSSDGTVISVGPNEALRNAINLMKTHDVSQLPVIDGKRIIGIVDESDLLLAAQSDKAAFKRPVREIMTTRLKTLRPGDSLQKVTELLKKGLVAIIADDDQFYGIVTKIDMVDYLRKTR